MADEKLTALTELTSTSGSALMYIVDPNISPSYRKITVANLHIYPQQELCLGDQFVIIAGGTGAGTRMTKAQGSGYYYAMIWNQGGTPAIDDEIATTMLLDAGTYNVTIFGSKNSNRPIVAWTLNGANKITGQDWYASGGTNVEFTDSWTIPAGRHYITCKVTGKNASSSSYVMGLTGISLVRTSMSSIVRLV